MTVSGWGRVEETSETEYVGATVLQTTSSLGYSYKDCCDSWYSAYMEDYDVSCDDPETAKEWVGPDVLCAGNITHEVCLNKLSSGLSNEVLQSFRLTILKILFDTPKMKGV